jgi:uncharacterized protein YycO
VKIIYCRRPNPGSLILRSFLWSNWSHCAILTDAGTVIEAAAFHGVIERWKAEFLQGIKPDGYAIREIPVPDEVEAISFARSQKGKPYDWNGVIGLALRRDTWQDDDAWFCSEFVEAALAAGGHKRFTNDARRVTPQHSWMVA